MASQRQWLGDLRAALELMKQGQPQNCIEALEKLCARYPDDALCRALVLDGIGRANFALQRPEEAIKALEDSVELLRSTLGATAPMTLGAMQNLAHALLGIELAQQGRIPQSFSDGVCIDVGADVIGKRHQRVELALSQWHLDQ